MGRQSGKYLLATVVLVGSLILANSDRTTESAPPQPTRTATSGHWLNWQSESLREQPPQTTCFPTQPTRTRLNNLPQGTRIVIGSLDVSGSRHVVTLTNSIAGATSAECVPVFRSTKCDIDRQLRCDYKPRSSAERNVWHRALPNLGDVTRQTTNVAEQQTRVFLIPHFKDTGIIHAPAECRVISENSRIRVYLDHRLIKFGNVGQIAAASEQLISAAETEALPIVEAWIGFISDVDHDRKLSIVISHLDQCSKHVSGASPINGCIREADFQRDANFGGDIVYVDITLLELPSAEQVSLLTHELTHAAVCSVPPQESGPAEADITESGCHSAGRRIPSWLNEAIAHLMELQCGNLANHDAGTSRNLQRRIDDFFADSGRSPIVAAEDVMSLEERRSGSRGAATLFLAPWLTSPETLQRFLRSETSLDRRIEDLAHESFADVFREWTLFLAATSVESPPLRVDIVPPDGDRERYSLLGTAFRCFECSEDVTSVVIESDASARLQISIIEPERNSTTMTSAISGTSELR